MGFIRLVSILGSFRGVFCMVVIGKVFVGVVGFLFIRYGFSWFFLVVREEVKNVMFRFLVLKVFEINRI